MGYGSGRQVADDIAVSLWGRVSVSVIDQYSTPKGKRPGEAEPRLNPAAWRAAAAPQRRRPSPTVATGQRLRREMRFGSASTPTTNCSSSSYSGMIEPGPAAFNKKGQYVVEPSAVDGRGSGTA